MHTCYVTMELYDIRKAFIQGLRSVAAEFYYTVVNFRR